MKKNLVAAAALCGVLLGSSTAQAQTCNGIWHWVDVDGTKCLDGSPTGFEYVCFPNLGPTGPLVVFLESGGACGDADTCNCTPNSKGVCQCTPNLFASFYGKAQSNDGLPWAHSYVDSPSATTPIFIAQGVPSDCNTTSCSPPEALNGPTSPFNDSSAGIYRWNFVYVPFCVGDTYMGNGKQHTFTPSNPPSGCNSKPYTVTFNGYNNVGLDIAQVQAMGFSPSKVALIGSSAGAVGVSCNMSRIAAALPQTRYAMEDGIAPFNPLFMPYTAWGEAFGAWVPDSNGDPIAKTCPIIANPGEEWGPSLVARYNAVNLPNIRKAMSDDYYDSTEDFFYCLLGARPDVNGSCALAVQRNLVEVLASDIGEDNPTDKVFYHSSVCHAERIVDNLDASSSGGADCTYDGMSTDGVMFRDWFRGWMQFGGYGWDTVK